MDTSSQFSQIAIRIIKEQEFIIGSLAWDEVRKVQGLQVLDQKKGKINLQNGDTRIVIDKLVAQYERIFGRASHEVCRDAVRDIIAEMPSEGIPSSFK